MKRFLKSALVIALCLSISACTQTSTPKEETIKIIDQAGREVTLEKPAEKVVSGYYIATSTLIGLGQKDKLVGVEMKADKRAIYQKAAPEITSLPAMGNKKSFNVEECAKAAPDVVFLPVSLKSSVDKLEELGMKVILLEPESMESFDEAVNLIAKACGAQEQADRYFQYRDTVEKNYLDTVKTAEKTVYFAGSDLLETSGEAMFQGELIKKAGGVNVITDMQQTSWMKISKETLLKADPAYIFAENQGADISEFTKDEAFKELQAVKQEQVYSFPSVLETWDTPNLSFVLGELWMSSILYPEAVSKQDVIKEAIAFYKEFYGIEVSAQDLGM